MIDQEEDKALIVQLSTGEESAFRKLYDRYWEQAYLSAKIRLEDDDLAKDVVQDVFINIWTLRETLNIKTEFKAYLFGAIKLRIIGYFQSEKIKKKVLSVAMTKMKEIESSVHDLSTYYEMEKVVSDAIDEFPENMRVAFLMRSDDKTIKEIAIELGIAEQTVKNNISEALRRLRITLSKKYPEQSLKYILVIATLVGDKLMNN